MVEYETIKILLLDIGDILAVFLRKNDIRDARTLGGKYLLIMPPTGITFPRRVISPVIARRGAIRRWVNADTIAVAIVIPADGPSLGMAPSGTWR